MPMSGYHFLVLSPKLLVGGDDESTLAGFILLDREYPACAHLKDPMTLLATNHAPMDCLKFTSICIEVQGLLLPELRCKLVCVGKAEGGLLQGEVLERGSQHTLLQLMLYTGQQPQDMPLHVPEPPGCIKGFWVLLHDRLPEA